LDASSVEGLAVDFYRRLGFDPERPVDTFRQARKLLGPDAIERGTALVGVPGRVFWLHGRRRIAVSRKLPVEYAQHTVGHELGHIVFDELGYRGECLEQLCDLFGAAVMAPIPAVRAMLRAFGRDHEAIADEVCSTQTWAALRIAEALGVPRAIVTPQRVYARGPESFVWGPEDSLRRLVRVERPGISRARLTDDPRRVVIDVEETG
jgi:IrrE N-terminal-like domain